MSKRCLTCGWSKVPDHARFCAMCGEQELEGSMVSKSDDLIPDETETSDCETESTEVISSEEVQDRLNRMQTSIEKEDGASPKSGEGFRSSRSFSETMWFIRGLDFDELVDDSEEVRQDDLQERYEGQEEVRDGIRKQFSLSSDFDDQDEVDE